MPSAAVDVLSPWIDLRQPSPAALLNLFCLPHAGGSAWQFRDWQRVFPPEIEVVPIQYPGRGRRIREPLCANMRELVEAAASSLRLAFQQRPFALFGHSMGSIAAFELARLLQRGGCSGAEMLIVAGASPPSRRPERREIWKLPDAEFIEELRIMNGTPDELLRDREAMMLLLPVIRRDLEVAESYRPEARVRVACPLVALGGTCDPDVSPEVIEKWGSHSIGEFQSHTFDGDHFFVNQNDQVTTCIAACLQPLLARLRARR